MLHVRRPALVLASAFALFSLPGTQADTAPVKVTSSCACTGCHGAYRWAVKSSAAQPPATIADNHVLKPSDITDWDGPGGTFTSKTLRKGKEREWFQVRGKLTHAKVEADGDLHLQLVDEDADEHTVNLIVEVPNGPAWCTIRDEVFGWTSAHFPISASAGRVLNLKKHPVIEVIGRAFYDATHAPGGDTTENQRAAVGGGTAAIWEIHAVMRLTKISP